jgi:DNA-binding response OmpR family regulator
MASARKILLADPDPATARALAPALRQRGFQVHTARDGSRALQITILRFPDLVIFDERCPLVDTRTFVRILRTNPRTERIPVILTGESDDPDRVRLGTYLRKPFSEDEVLSRIDQVFRRVEAARAVSGESREIEGNLAQIPLVDLLQILSVNKKTGRLTVEREGEQAEIALRDGRVLDAALGTVGGEKALYRLLSRHDGTFAFVPGQLGEVAERIDRRIEELMLEGLRQADEEARLEPLLPKPTDTIELAVAPSEIPAGLHPITEEVVALLSVPRLFLDLVDRCPASDLEVERAVLALLDRGFARRREGALPSGPAALLAPHELHALRARIARGHSSGPQTVGKVVVVGGGPLARQAARIRFETLAGWQAEAEPEWGFGTIGRLTLSDGVRVDLTELPGDPQHRPLWRPFASGAVGALLLLPAEDSEALVVELSRVLRLPLVVCGPREARVPAGLRDGHGVSFHGSDAAEGLRALLAGAGMRSEG